ncbi:Thioredoxin [Mycoplasmopsis bovigenitalium]|uniref:Thioredoxin n=1 Tax=Mycoplasmopsis bovigenitalium TaxID=2112 RepID=A0A449A8G2_9BACT|nr:thioredoxin family protein [Mycoplasmopsis bovigenitalium]VEU60552.1 Thioredoxin [Mycoplasmopsis bovigenitalium]
MKDITQAIWYDEIKPNQKGVYLLVFHAVWCPPCRMFKESSEELANKDGIPVFRVDVDQNMKLSGEFGITNLPTWFIMKDGEVLQKMIGYKPYNELKQDVLKHVN